VIVLDTNVISEVMRPLPSAAVLAWLRSMPLHELATTTICVAEIGYGLARLPYGRRRTQREAAFARYRAHIFEDRIFAFDVLAADAYGELVAVRERLGRPLEGADGLIAAIALSRGVSVATRDVGGFGDCGFPVVNPWDTRHD
jgi:predicted nucleic acid-binding protein